MITFARSDFGFACLTGRWPNVYTNLKNIDYCTDQFNYIT
jgi:hypothetical protein